jgi:hypothetical protein
MAPPPQTAKKRDGHEKTIRNVVEFAREVRIHLRDAQVIFGSVTAVDGAHDEDGSFSIRPLGTHRVQSDSVRRHLPRVSRQTNGLETTPRDRRRAARRRLRPVAKDAEMNLGTLAAWRGEAWAKRVMRRSSDTAKARRPWPGKSGEARRLARSFGRPELVDALAAIIQEQASAVWSFTDGASTRKAGRLSGVGAKGERKRQRRSDAGDRD